MNGFYKTIFLNAIFVRTILASYFRIIIRWKDKHKNSHFIFFIDSLNPRSRQKTKIKNVQFSTETTVFLVKVIMCVPCTKNKSSNETGKNYLHTLHVIFARAEFDVSSKHGAVYLCTRSSQVLCLTNEICRSAHVP